VDDPLLVSGLEGLGDLPQDGQRPRPKRILERSVVLIPDQVKSLSRGFRRGPITR
jgi:hypothetical protein